jgi:hypothetical protein
MASSLVNNFGSRFREPPIEFEVPKLFAFIHHDSRWEGTGIHTAADRRRIGQTSAQRPSHWQVGVLDQPRSRSDPKSGSYNRL